MANIASRRPFNKPPRDVRDARTRELIADFDESWPVCQHASDCDERVNPRRVEALGGRVVCLLHGPTKLEAIERAERNFVPGGAKQGYTHVSSDARARHVTGLYKGQNQHG